MEENRYRPPNVLRLPGITIKDDYVPIEDFADELFNSHETGLEDPAHESILPLDKIPREFTSIEDWPHETNLRCWSCGYTFKGCPVFVPKDVRESESGGIEFGVLGNMCSFPCAELWISIHFAAKEDQRWRAQDNLCLVYLLFTGHHVARILPAPHKTELQKYGGDLDEDTFFQKIRRLDPLTGTRDHMTGIIGPERVRTQLVPESLRVKTALAKLRASSGAPALRAVTSNANTSETCPVNNPGDPLVVGQKSVWRVCGLPFEENPAACACADSIAITPSVQCMDAFELLLTDCATDGPGSGLHTDIAPPATSAGSNQTPETFVRLEKPTDSKSPTGSKSPTISNADMDDILAELGVF